MRQRLGLAAALLREPTLLLLDEPSNGMDPAGIKEFRTLLRSLADEGTTVFLSSHQLAEVEQVCDEIAVLDGGRLVEHGRVADLTTARAPTAKISHDSYHRSLKWAARCCGRLHSTSRILRAPGWLRPSDSRPANVFGGDQDGPSGTPSRSGRSIV
jgi:ABC-type multidrug transport system ATPase subunit